MSYNEENINTREQMEKMKEEARNRPPVKVITISDSVQEDINRLNSNFRKYLDEWYGGGDLKKIDYLNLVLRLREVEALEKRKGR